MAPRKRSNKMNYLTLRGEYVRGFIINYNPASRVRSHATEKILRFLMGKKDKKSAPNHRHDKLRKRAVEAVPV